jgi:predicted DCC family thiol-disulfide oxidoreductase YuxK
LIVAGARAIFREPYARRTMTCGTTVGPDETRHVWHRVQGAGGLDVWAEGGARAPSDTSADRWLTHHDLGLGRGWRRARTHIYRVEHPCWPCHPVTRWSLDLDLERLYGRRLQSVVSGEPWRVVLAAGSRVSVSPPMTPGTVGNLDGARSLTAGRALLLYDEDCGICTHTVRMINRYDRDGQVRPVGIRSKAGARALADLTPTERLQTWHLIEADGTRLSGGAALPALCRRLPGLQLTERLLRRFPTAADTFYAAIAARRHGLSSLLGLNACSVEERTP